LGCVIKGETDHYHVVKDITLSKIYDFSYENNFPISNALLTVENYSQALERSKVDKKNLGENAAKVCLELIKKINEK
jgi:6,7-dimethyl-8-ribityllumazine synthase